MSGPGSHGKKVGSRMTVLLNCTLPTNMYLFCVRTGTSTEDVPRYPTIKPWSARAAERLLRPCRCLLSHFTVDVSLYLGTKVRSSQHLEGCERTKKRLLSPSRGHEQMNCVPLITGCRSISICQSQCCRRFIPQSFQMTDGSALDGIASHDSCSARDYS